jgi:hypothetical protein
MTRGVARAGSGRKSKSEELGTSILARAALIKKYGTLEKALTALLESNESALIKFVFEHAFGKPTEKIQQNSEKTITIKRAVGNHLRRTSRKSI